MENFSAVGILSSNRRASPKSQAWLASSSAHWLLESPANVLIPLACFSAAMASKNIAIVALAVPFSAVGAIWLVWALGYNMSVGVWVGLIALLGLDAETGVFMLLFLDLSYHDAVRKGKMNSYEDLREAIIHGAVKRVRPKAMTVMAAMMGLLPIMWSMGTGADMMKRIAAPMIAGLVTSFIMELLVYPAIYYLWKWRTEVRHIAAATS